MCARLRGVGLVQLLRQSGSRRKTCPACGHGRNGSLLVPGRSRRLQAAPKSAGANASAKAATKAAGPAPKAAPKAQVVSGMAVAPSAAKCNCARWLPPAKSRPAGRYQNVAAKCVGVNTSLILRAYDIPFEAGCGSPCGASTAQHNPEAFLMISSKTTSMSVTCLWRMSLERGKGSRRNA